MLAHGGSSTKLQDYGLRIACAEAGDSPHRVEADGSSLALPPPSPGERWSCTVSATRLPRLEAKVEVVEPTGAETMVVIRLGGREVIARVDPDDAQAPGSLMRFAVDMRKACLFDPASERLIG